MLAQEFLLSGFAGAPAASCSLGGAGEEGVGEAADGVTASQMRSNPTVSLVGCEVTGAL